MKRFLAKILVHTQDTKKRIIKAVSYFVAGFILDLLIAKEYIYITTCFPISAALVSGLITIISTYIISKIIKDSSSHAMLGYAAGNAIGTYAAI